jgi:glutathione peroxidase
VVNVASRCGFTSQYEGLEALYRTHGQAGLTVLGFPCDQFAHQEPGDNATIQQFCDRHYHVTFPLYAKIQVNGAQTHPLYQWLKQARPGMLGILAIKWNFTKFLVSREGQVLKRYAPYVKPVALNHDIEIACGA